MRNDFKLYLLKSLILLVVIFNCKAINEHSSLTKTSTDTFIFISDTTLSSNYAIIKEGSISSPSNHYYHGDTFFFADSSSLNSFCDSIFARENIQLPKMDLTKHRIIVVLDSMRGSSGYSLNITGIAKRNRNNYFAKARLQEYLGVTLTVITQPYSIVSVPIK